MFNLAIIGGGPAGYTAAHRAMQNGLSVVLFEKKAIGGVCLNEGCIPTKTLLYSAKQYCNALHADKYGINTENTSYNWSRIQQRKTKIIRKLQAGIRQKFTAPEGLTNVTYIQAEAIVKSYEPQHITLQAAGEIFEAENLLLCTGSTNFLPPIEGIDSPAVIDSTQALNLTELPQSIIIVGGGVIGMEFATLYNELGVKVTVIEALPHILANIDTDITDYLVAKYQKSGVVFHTETKVQHIENNRVICSHHDETLTLEADKILVCVGRRPNLNGFECVDIEREGRCIKINDSCRTSLPNIYAAGDITGKLMLAHVASRQAEVAIDKICGKQVEPINYQAIPSVVYTNPEIAVIGSTTGAKIIQAPMTFSGRFVAENEAENGLCKLVIDNDNRIIGAHLIGNTSSEIIAIISLTISQQLTIEQFSQTIFPHPTVSEIFKEIL